MNSAQRTCVGREELWALEHRMLDASDESRVKAHVAECAACREALAGYQRLDAVLDEWKPSEPSPWFDARVRANVATARPARRGLAGLLGAEWVRWLAPALSVFVIVVGLAFLRRDRRAAENERQASAAAAAHNAAAAQAHAADQELSMYENLPVLEDYDMLSSADVLSELPKTAGKDDNAAD